MKKLLATTALGVVLAAAPTMAQDQKPAESQPSMQNQAPTGGETTAPKGQTDTQGGQAGAMDKGPQSASAEKFIDSQEQGQWLASDLIGQMVYNANDENVGEINDLLFDDNGNVVAAVLGVGGFLGIGEKPIAVGFDNLEVGKDQNNETKISLDMSREDLQSAPDFVSWDDRQSEANRNASQSGTPPAQ